MAGVFDHVYELKTDGKLEYMLHLEEAIEQLHKHLDKGYSVTIERVRVMWDKHNNTFHKVGRMEHTITPKCLL